ncbi:MAG: TRAP transporter small permease [Spirochaetaceae bacterium]|nr:TRAP transporter small permease [Spirochaetaceae bacterium]
MGKFAGTLRAIDTAIHKVLLIIAQVALFAMIAIVCVTVFFRYVLSSGIIWAEEVPRTLVALFAFIACAMGVRDHLHIGLGFFHRRFAAGGKGRRILDALINLSTFSCGAIMTFYGWNLCQQLWRFTMPATGLPRTVQYISMPIAGTIIMYDSLLFLFGVLKEDELLFSEKEEELHVIHLKKHHADEKRENE